MKEIFKDIEGYEGLYQISNLGRVKSFPRNGTYKKMRVLKQSKNTQGYWFVNLSKNNKQKGKVIHRLIAIHFIPNPTNKPYINHKDSDRGNYAISNLEWVTGSENIKHCYRQGNRTQKGENNNHSKLNPADIKKIRELSKTQSGVLISSLFNISVATVSQIKNQKTWRHI